MAQHELNNVHRRPVRDTDRAFLLRVFASYMERSRELMEAEVPDEMWDQVVLNQFNLQDTHYRDAWSDGGSFEIIEIKGKPVGRIYLWRGVDQGVEQIRIVEFTLLTEYRNQEIGSQVMREVLAWGDDVGLPVRTRLAPFELSQSFLARHGFELLEDEKTSLHFERQPSSPGAPDAEAEPASTSD